MHFKIYVSFFICFVLLPCFSQFQFETSTTIPVYVGNDTLKNAWDGGLNYTQFSDIDFDLDGDLDLLLFDRSSNQLRVYRKDINGNNYSYHLEFNAREKFPSDLRYRLFTTDYDNDGDKDLFTYGIGGIKVYKNISNPTDGLKFELFKNILSSVYSGGSSNLFVSSSDIPAIIDVDLDGDIDILTFNGGGSRIEYHKNLSIENYGIPDSLEFELFNECWGNFEEGSADNTIILNPGTSPCNGDTWVSDPQKSAKHTGSTIMAFDYDNSGVMDLLLGDVAHENVVLVLNGGTTVNSNSSMVSVENNFPSNTSPAQLFIFPACFYLDVNNDNVKDLVIGANAKNVSQNRTSIRFYENLGTNQNPNFIARTDAFLQEEMIDNGLAAIPVLVDENNDGLKDLLVANFFRYKAPLDKEAAVQLFRNIGTASQPEFRLITEDWKSFSSANIGLRVVPTFGDLNGDGKNDMLVGTEMGKFHYYQNNSSSGELDFAAPVFNITDHQGTEINTFTHASPQLFDLNEDGLLDLIIGKKTGEIMYYKNIGTTTNYSFELITENLGQVNVGNGSSDAFNVPHFKSVNDTLYLFCGAKNGRVFLYSDIENNLNDGDSFNLVSDEFLNIDVSSYSAPFIYDVDNDGRENLFLGTDLGGVWLYESNPDSNVGLEETEINFSIYPNPSSGIFTINTEVHAITIEVFNTLGKRIYQERLQKGKNQVELFDCPKGLYYVHFSAPNKPMKSSKIIIR
ncbi:MAG: T9SS type A sorting domain-containing protein [Lishizhenia sp.]